MTTDPRALRNLPKYLVLASALLFAGMYFFTALPRIVYPYDLDFDEDSILMQTLRLVQGQPVYVPPNAVFNPHVYMPFYFWLGSWLIRLTGPNLVPLRLLSLAATLTTTALIYFIARRESRHAWIALACAGLYLGGYRINGFWYEVIRVDSLFVALLLGGLALGIYAGGSKARLMLSAFVLALSFFTKQSGAFIGAGLGIYLLLISWRRALWFLVPFGVLTLAPLFALDLVTGGWFSYHVFYIGSADPIELGRLVQFISLDLISTMGALTLMALLAALWSIRAHGWGILKAEPWLIALALAILISALGRARVGGNLNNRMPAYALLCLAPALLFNAWSKTPVLRLPCNLRLSPEPLVAALILLQFALGAYYPPRYIPTAQMRASGDRLIERIAAVDGPVFVMMHPFYALLAGKETSTQMATLWYVRHRGELPFPEDFVDRLQSRYYTAIISDESDFETEPALRALLQANYPYTETLSSNEAPPTTTGVVVQPRVIYYPNPP